MTEVPTRFTPIEYKMWRPRLWTARRLINTILGPEEDAIDVSVHRLPIEEGIIIVNSFKDDKPRYKQMRVRLSRGQECLRVGIEPIDRNGWKGIVVNEAGWSLRNIAAEQRFNTEAQGIQATITPNTLEAHTYDEIHRPMESLDRISVAGIILTGLPKTIG